MLEESRIVHMRDFCRAFQHNSALGSADEERKEYGIRADVLDWVLDCD